MMLSLAVQICRKKNGLQNMTLFLTMYFEMIKNKQYNECLKYGKLGIEQAEYKNKTRGKSITRL